MTEEKKYFVGKNSLITDDVKIGEGSRIWHFCNLYGCEIGNNTQIGSYTEVKKGAKIGDNCRFQSHVFIPEGTQIGNYVFLGPRVTILNDKFPSAKSAIDGDWDLEAAIIEDEVTIGGNVTILPGVRIRRGAFVGAGAVVTKDVPEYRVVYGNPAKFIGDARDEKYQTRRKFIREGESN